MADYQWITSRISVGAALTAADVPQLVADGISHVCDVTQHDDDEFLRAIQDHPAINVLWLDTGDDGGSKVELYKQIPSWFLAAWADPHAKFNFHCDGGCNRGPSASYLALRLLEWPAAQAEQAIRTARSAVGPGCLRYVNDAEAAIAALGYS